MSKTLTKKEFIKMFNSKSIEQKEFLLLAVGVSQAAINEFKVDSDTDAASIVENWDGNVICDIWTELENGGLEN